jgi:prepilin-type processing-associated H-X9-DG protein
VPRFHRHPVQLQWRGRRTYIRFAASNTGGTFSSRHDGGVTFAFLDGSVHFLSSTTSDRVRMALGTIQGGEDFSIEE